MDVTKDMRTTKHFFWRKLAGGGCADWTKSECFVARKHENKQKMSRSAEFGGHVDTEQETSEQSQRKEARVEIEKIARWNVGARAKDSVNCNQENVAEAAIAVYDWVLLQFNHSWAICFKGSRAGMTAAFIGPNVNPPRKTACSTSQRQRRQCTKCQALGSMIFAAVVCDANEPCFKNIAWESGSSFTMSPRSTTRFFFFFLKFLIPTPNSWDERCPSMARSALLPFLASLITSFLFWFSSAAMPVFSRVFHSLFATSFASGIFIASGIKIEMIFWNDSFLFNAVFVIFV